jgi:hypothetical protein
VAVLTLGDCEVEFPNEGVFHHGMSCRNEFFKEVDRMDKGRSQNEQGGRMNIQNFR